MPVQSSFRDLEVLSQARRGDSAVGRGFEHFRQGEQDLIAAGWGGIYQVRSLVRQVESGLGGLIGNQRADTLIGENFQ